MSNNHQAQDSQVLSNQLLVQKLDIKFGDPLLLQDGADIIIDIHEYIHGIVIATFKDDSAGTVTPIRQINLSIVDNTKIKISGITMAANDVISVDYRVQGNQTASLPVQGAFGPLFVPLATTGAQLPVSGDLASAGSYAVMGKAGITDSGASSITGSIGVSPIASTAIVGFGLTLDGGGQFATSAKVSGRVYAANYAAPTPANLTSAISNMEAAYTDAAGRSNPDYTELGAGNIGGMTLYPGLYKWAASLAVTTNVTLHGGADDVFIFQVGSTFNVSNGVSILLTGGLQPKNIYWAVGSAATFGTTAHVEGVVLAQTAITMNTGSSINGRLYAQTAVTIDSTVLVQSV